MTETVDPRLARRRREVQEASARRRLRWTIGLLVLAVAAGMVVAVFESSWFAVDSITIEGASRADVASILNAAGVEDGVSIVSVRAGRIEDKLREDPWIAEAQVRVLWPRSIEVSVVEYIPIARIKSGDTWLVASTQGSVLARGQRLVDPFIDIEAGDLHPGDVIENSDALGALEFVSALPVELKDGLVVTSTGSELKATVSGHNVILGSAVDMAQKAVTLAVLLQQGIADGASINLVSPIRPAVTNPQGEVEGSQQVTTETTDSG
ncbi:MAG: FtsQ-type POTRA domain-containing protein [Acidimicrobiia bacterium]